MPHFPKCLGLVTLKILPTNCFRCNSKRNNKKLAILKVKLNKINTNFPLQVLCKIFRRFRGNNKFFKTFLSIYLKKRDINFNPSQNSYSLMIWWWLQIRRWLLANVSNKKNQRLILHIPLKREIFKISLVIKN